MNNQVFDHSSRSTYEHPARGCFSARMILLTANYLIAAVLLTGCAVSPQVPNAARQNYPAVIKDSVDRRSKAEREWRRMLDAYGIAQTPPDFYPITNTPRSLLGVAGAVQILNYKPDPGDEALALREAVKGFMDRWRDLLGLDPATISLVNADESSDTKRLTFRQANYVYPIGGNFGEMVIVLSKSGVLMQLDDRFVPVVDLPLKPSIERDIAGKKVAGKTFTYSDIAGREQRTQINSPGEVSVKRLVVFPIEKSDAVEVHLAWEVIAGTSLSWTVYIDAITGEELRVVQNFRT
jgi:hypothetical protein